jgi:hypothetical protein
MTNSTDSMCDFEEERDRPEPVSRPGTATARVCSVCLSPWTATGQHRIACLKCGHLFGKSCIERWVRMHAVCPECKRAAKIGEVRVLYTANFAVADTAERDAAQELVKRERRERMRVENENRALRARVERLENEVKRKKSGQDQVYKLEVRVDVAEGRSVDVGRIEVDGVMVTCKGNKGEFGVKRISPVDWNHSVFIPCGTKALRDVRVGKGRELAMCGGLGKELQVVSLKAEAIVLQYTMKHAIWSCCWGGDDEEFYAFCGDEVGNVYLFDIRNTKDVLKTFPCEAKGIGHRGIHSLQRMGTNRVAVGSLDYSRIISCSADNEMSEAIQIPDLSLCSSISVDKETQDILCVVRNPISDLSHFVYKMDENNALNIDYSFQTSDKLRTVLARSAICGSLVCTPEEQSKKAVLYDSGVPLFKSEAHPSHILDTSFSDTGKWIITSSASQIQIYSSAPA